MENKKRGLDKIAKSLLFAWLGLFILALIVFLYVTVVRGELFNTTSNILSLTFLGAFGLGSLLFLLSIFFYNLNEQVKNSEHPNWFTAFLKSLSLLFVFPVYFIFKTISSYKRIKAKLLDARNGLLLGAIFIILPFWLLGYLLLFMGSSRIFGLRYYMSSGMGSDTMLPTLPKDSQFRLYSYKNIHYKINQSFAYKLQHGDIISFSNTATKQLLSVQNIADSNFVGRIIALPGDTVELKGGIVFLSGKALDEPYTLTPNSTHVKKFEYKGKTYGDFMSECKTLTIPSNEMFVLVDNRENGDDSRIIGLVDFSDIDAYLPLKVQTEGYQGDYSNIIKNNSSWRQPNATLTQEALVNASTACK